MFNKWKNKKRYICCYLNSLIAAVGIFFLVSSSQCTQKESIPQIVDTIPNPYQEGGASTLYCYGDSRLLWILKSEYSRRDLNDTSSMLVVPVDMIIYDTASEKSTHVLADSGITKRDLNYFFIWGNVHIKNHDGQVIKSQSLWWNKSTRRVGTDDYVQIQTPSGDVLRGKGLDAADSFSEWTLREEVSGKFPNFRDRIEEENQNE